VIEIPSGSEYQVATQWFIEPVGQNFTGWDAQGWDASTLILHAMYELKSGADAEDAERGHTLEHLELSSPSIAGVTGYAGGYLAAPGHGWHRLGWSEFARRFPGALFPEPRYLIPSHAWSYMSEMPETIMPPSEGSLDEASFNALLPILMAHSPEGADTECVALYAELLNMGRPARLFRGRLGSIPDLLHGEDRMICTPNNFWPADRSWFVWTDWDLWATRVSGDQALIRDMRGHPDLELHEEGQPLSRE